ncbi:hypothetical protein FWH13_03285 [Candidatus Saccharibacteria bacterium]|nr:hypothetical protein [Candidatus Saccharibacteria bacterium]
MSEFLVGVRNHLRTIRQNWGWPQTTIALIALVGVWWLFQAVQMMARNYEQQVAYAEASRRAEILQLEVLQLEYTVEYHRTLEFQELRLREEGLVRPDESVLILPIADEERPRDPLDIPDPIPESHLSEWRRFFGL